MIVSPVDPAAMSPKARRAEVAAILATGYLRLKFPGNLPLKELDVSCPPTAPCDCLNNGERAGEEAA